ncbi:MAG: acetyl-CoA carboxylase biotin carboxyl carrier protein, partial [Chitinophagaceae bacterium]
KQKEEHITQVLSGPTYAQSLPALAHSQQPITIPSTAAASADKTKATDGTPSPSNLVTIKSPMIGTFYRKSSPDKPNFVEPGDEVTQGKVVCIIEAMKLFNEIESEVSGKVVKILVEDASPVEYDQPLFLVEPA